MFNLHWRKVEEKPRPMWSKKRIKHDKIVLTFSLDLPTAKMMAWGIGFSFILALIPIDYVKAIFK